MRPFCIVVLSLRTDVEHGDGAGAGVCADDGAGGGNDDLGNVQLRLQLLCDPLRILQAVAVADGHGLGGGVDRGLANLVHHGLQGGLSASYLGHIDEVTLVVHVEDGLDAQHGARNGGDSRNSAAAL